MKTFSKIDIFDVYFCCVAINKSRANRKLNDIRLCQINNAETVNDRIALSNRLNFKMKRQKWNKTRDPILGTIREERNHQIDLARKFSDFFITLFAWHVMLNCNISYLFFRWRMRQKSSIKSPWITFFDSFLSIYFFSPFLMLLGISHAISMKTKCHSVSIVI